MNEVDPAARAAIAALVGGEELEPVAVARLVGEMPEQTMRELVTGEILAAASEQIIRRFPDYVDASRTAGVEAAIEWVITDPGASGPVDRVVVLIEDGTVTAGRDLDHPPRVTLTLDAVDFLRLATGNANPATMFLGGRLGLDGDALFAIEMASFLRIPGADGERSAADAIDPSAVDATEIARVVSETSEDDLRRAIETGPAIRALILDEVIRRFPEYVEAERTRGVDAAVGWVITGTGVDERFVVAFDDGSVEAGRELDAEPRVTLELDAVDFLRLATGNADPASLFIGGRLGLSGDELFAIEMASFLRIPGSEGETDAEQAIDPSAVDATRIAAVVRDAPDEALRRGMQGAIRELILEEIFRRFPEYFKRGPLNGSEVAIAFKITGRADGDADRYRVLIRDEEILAGKDLDVDPRVTIVIDGVDFLKLVTGNANPVMSFITGKLKIKGDLAFAAQIPGLFRIPSAAG